MRPLASYILFLGILFFASTIFAAEHSILLNEIHIDSSPQSVELINIGEESEDISNWYIDDSGGTTFYTIPEDSILQPNSCLVFSSSFNFNKTSFDMVRLFNDIAPPTSTEAALIDTFLYDKSPGEGISYARIPDGENNWTTASATLGKFNQTELSCVVEPTKIPTLTPTPRFKSPSPTPTFPTLTPLQKNLDISPTHRPQLKQILFNMSSATGTPSSQGDVLSEVIKPADTQVAPLIKTFSFISLSYSILTICSVFFKMKFRL